MGYPLYGHELNELNSPISFSNGSFINLDKDFIGKNKIINDLENKSKKAQINLLLLINIILILFIALYVI